MNRVNRSAVAAQARSEDAGRSSGTGGHAWSNIGALRALVGRADRELGREPGAYLAVALVHGDKAEEQVGRWVWSGSRDAGSNVAALSPRLGPTDRGLRVRVHHEGGKLVGSVLLRRHQRDVRPPPRVVAAPDVAAEQRLATLEARLSVALDRVARQEAEIVAMRTELSRLEYVPTVMTNMHHRLDAVEAVCERLETEPAPAEERDGDEDEPDEDEDEDDDNWDDGYGEDDLDDGEDD